MNSKNQRLVWFHVTMMKFAQHMQQLKDLTRLVKMQLVINKLDHAQSFKNKMHNVTLLNAKQLVLQLHHAQLQLALLMLQDNIIARSLQTNVTMEKHVLLTIVNQQLELVSMK
jgi:hypothetical protein